MPTKSAQPKSDKKPNTTSITTNGSKKASQELPFSADEIIKDYRIGYRSRMASLLGRREVLSGKAKFGIFGDGKEVPQLAMARAFQNGDWRSGYYRDQTFMLAAGLMTIEGFFAQLYAHVDVEAEPASAGRMMNGHFATRTLNEDGSWKDLTSLKNSSADISPTGSQMPRLLGLAYASKLFRQLPEMKALTNFSKNGNEVAFGTIGNASTSEGLFFETINAGGLLQVPMVVSIWDDEYGISVHAKHQTCKQSISSILEGFKLDDSNQGYIIHTLKGWDYPTLCKAYIEGVAKVRKYQMPAIYHITELTQPQGHSTSGSHERYKSKERLEWELEYDCLKKMREWMIASSIATDGQLSEWEAEDKKFVDEAKARAWEAYLAPILKEIEETRAMLESLATESRFGEEIRTISKSLAAIREPIRKDAFSAIKAVLRLTRSEEAESRSTLKRWLATEEIKNAERYSSDLYDNTDRSALNVPVVRAEYNDSSKKVDGRQVLQACFDSMLARDARVFAIGEDIGTIGDVNKAFEDLQGKHGEWRVTDTGIREATILGQGIGAAMRGLRPIVEIQYLDYLLYAIQLMSDDIATVRYRTKAGQRAPVIVRTRGHRLEGIWHSGSPIGMILNAVRGMHVLVPRNMTQAAGMYNTLLKAEEPAVLVEVLNGYRLKELVPSNIAEFTVPLGIPEVLRDGSDVTVVTYGACCRLAVEAANELDKLGVSTEVIDVQTLLPFDRTGEIVKSLKKTSRILFLDEDVPGGASAYMMQQVIEHQGGFKYLDTNPRTLTAKDHRPAYGSDGDYFSKPSVDDIIAEVYSIMREARPEDFPEI